MMLEITLVCETILTVLALIGLSLFFLEMNLFMYSEIRLCSKFFIAMIAAILKNTIMNFNVSIEV